MIRTATRLFYPVLRAVLRSPRRSGFTVLSVGASLCVIGLLFSIRAALFDSAPAAEQARRLVVHSRVSMGVPIPVYYGDVIAKLPHVQEVMYSQWFGGVYKDYRDPNNFFGRFAVEPAKLFRLRPELSLSNEEKIAFLRDRTGCILGGPLAKRLGLHRGDRVTLRGDIFPVTLDLTVRGIFASPTSSEVLYFSKDYFVETLPAERRGDVGNFIVLVADPSQVSRVASVIDSVFRSYPVQTRAETEQAFSLRYLFFLGDLKFFIFGVSMALAVATLFICGNTMTMAVRERIRETAVLKTLGFSRRMVFGMLLAESLLITTFGWLLALAIDAALCRAVRNSPFSFEQLHRVEMHAPEILALLAIAAAVGLVSAAIPAASAARTPIVRGIRFAG